jgi:hypothetical protein
MSFDGPDSETFPLSLSQQQVWLDQQAHPGSALYNIGGCCFLAGPLDPDHLATALETLVTESEALRLLPLPDGTQRLTRWPDPVLERVDLGPVADPAAAIRHWWQEAFRRPFRLDGRSRPWRVVLLLAEDEGGNPCQGVMVLFHHLVMDGWGTAWLFQRWAECYNALAEGRFPVSGEDSGYRRFVKESLAYADSAAFRKDAAYWKGRLPVLPPPLIEERYRTLVPVRPCPARLHSHFLPRPLYHQLERFAATQGGSI